MVSLNSGLKGSLFVLGLCAHSVLASPNFPFPQNLDLQGISPTSQSVAQNNQDVRQFYDAWKSSYLRQAQSGGYYVHGADTDGDGKGTSESHGYGMLITALIAGHDVQAKEEFDGLWDFFDRHRSTINSELMGWKINSQESSASYSSATDGDMDIAYALLLADKQWGSTGAINYRQEAVDMINKGLKVSDYNPSSHRLMLGDWDSNPYTSRSSDWMPAHLRAYQEATGDQAWTSALNEIYDMVETINETTSTGLMPDFVTGSTAAPDYNNDNLTGEKHSGDYFYNAARTPLRIAMDYLHHGESRSKVASDKLVTWVKTQIGSNYDFSKYYAGYTIQGVSLPTADYTDTVFVAPVIVAAATNPNNQAMVNAGWEYIKNQKTNYFSDTVNLLSMLALTGNWWTPASANVGGGSIFPTAVAQSVELTVDQSVVIQLAGFDDGSVVEYELFEEPIHGQVSLVGNQATYIPAPGYSGEDEFSFIVRDDDGLESEPAQVNLLVNDQQTGGLNCEVVETTWAGGFSASVTLSNTGSNTVNSWEVGLELSDSDVVTQMWSANFIVNNQSVTASNLSWNGKMESGDSVTFGFNGSFDGNHTTPVCLQ